MESLKLPVGNQADWATRPMENDIQTISLIIHECIEGERTIGASDTQTAEVIAHQLNSLTLLGGGTVRTQSVNLLDLNNTDAIADFFDTIIA